MPYAIEIGGFLIDTERVVLALCVFSAISLARWLGGRAGIGTTAATRAGETNVLGGLAAARLTFVWQQWPAY